jgi:hypothetical protein
MKYVDTGDIHKDEVEEYLFDKRGTPVLSDKEVVVKPEGKKDRHFVLTHDSAPHDPWGMYKNREKNLKMVIKSVSKETFDYYMLFLKTRNSLYMTRAQRSFIND